MDGTLYYGQVQLTRGIKRTLGCASAQFYGPLYSFGQRIATRVDDALYCVHRDHPSTSSGHGLASTVAVSDAAGGEVGRVQYDPYGEIITSTLPLPLPQSVLQYQGTGDGTSVSPPLNKGGTAYENPTKPPRPADS